MFGGKISVPRSWSMAFYGAYQMDVAVRLQRSSTCVRPWLWIPIQYIGNERSMDPRLADDRWVLIEIYT